MKFKLDENLPRSLCVRLNGLGHDTDTIEEEGLAGVDDRKVIHAAMSEGRVLLTLDKDFANLLDFPADTHAGIVVFRPDVKGRKSISAFVLSRLSNLLDNE